VVATPAPNLLFPIFVTGQLAGSLLGPAIKKSGLTPNEFAVLSIIVIYEPITPTDLAQRAGMPPTTLSDYIARLSRWRLVKRSPNPDDGRSYRLTATVAGHRRNGVAIEGLLETNRLIAEHLAGDPAKVRKSLDELELALRSAVSTKS
jgi:DNA-binding MarR family transcriptional regulator